MKKIVICIFIIVITIFYISGCSNNKAWNTAEMEKGLNSSEITDGDIVTTLKDLSFNSGKKVITITLKNITNKEFTYTKEPHLEVLIKNEWYMVPIKDNVAIDEMAMILKPNEINVYVENLSLYYDNLITGHYRYLKFFGDNNGESTMAKVEFDIK